MRRAVGRRTRLASAAIQASAARVTSSNSSLSEPLAQMQTLDQGGHTAQTCEPSRAKVRGVRAVPEEAVKHIVAETDAD